MLWMFGLCLVQGSLDRGFGRCIVSRKFSTTMKRYPNQSCDRITPPPPSECLGTALSVFCCSAAALVVVMCVVMCGVGECRQACGQVQGAGSGRHSACGRARGQAVPHHREQGDPHQHQRHARLPHPARQRVHLRPSALQVPVRRSAFAAPNLICFHVVRDTCHPHSTSQSGYAEKVLLTSNESENFVVKIKMRTTRRPELGDKFSRYTIVSSCFRPDFLISSYLIVTCD